MCERPCLFRDEIKQPELEARPHALSVSEALRTGQEPDALAITLSYGPKTVIMPPHGSSNSAFHRVVVAFGRLLSLRPSFPLG